jgi:hypothetical protein
MTMFYFCFARSSSGLWLRFSRKLEKQATKKAPKLFGAC